MSHTYYTYYTDYTYSMYHYLFYLLHLRTRFPPPDSYMYHDGMGHVLSGGDVERVLAHRCCAPALPRSLKRSQDKKKKDIAEKDAVKRAEESAAASMIGDARDEDMIY